MLGLFDSGLGGLTVLRRLRERLPHAGVLYFADQANVPYGDHTPEELAELLRANVAWLNERGVDAIVMACNTSCATARAHGWPPSEAPIFDLIDSAAIAVARGGFRDVAVVATVATVRSNAYARAITEHASGTRVTEIAAPALVPLIESLHGGDPRILEAVARVCEGVPRGADAVVYGCTHYPLVDDAFAKMLGARARVDPAIVQAERVADAARVGSIARGDAALHFVTTGALEPFAERVSPFGGTVARIEGIA